MTLGHEKLDDYRPSIDYGAWVVYEKAGILNGVHQAVCGNGTSDFDPDSDFDSDKARPPSFGDRHPFGHGSRPDRFVGSRGITPIIYEFHRTTFWLYGQPPLTFGGYREIQGKRRRNTAPALAASPRLLRCDPASLAHAHREWLENALRSEGRKQNDA